ncbi:DUF1902 domain-containing protein [Methyloferula stellata]|uniref:DUF1902 domain-containing protein n=1 Tax=Methyloferula stellata TaxID=876270 RepID=UPI0003702AC8|nr:DUF1902 domain-containing protein [Methyloferula stellata]
MTYVVHVSQDRETGRYYVDSSDIPGLHVEADTFEEFVNIVQDVAPDLLGEAAPGSEISFQQIVTLAA